MAAVLGQKATASPTAISIASAGVDTIREHAASLLSAHAAELEPHMGEPKPNWRAYYELEERGMLLALGAWIGDELVGYAVAFVIDELHYDVTVCQHDVIYVKPEWRHAGVGPWLMEELEELAKAHGAKAMLMHAKPGTALEKVLPRRGYKHEETVFRKELECQQPCP